MGSFTFPMIKSEHFSEYMVETHTFLTPDYFSEFSCKMGACRSACCEGWPITVSMQNYFRLIGMNCKKSLRDRLDIGLRVLDRPNEDEYARFEPRYDGNCPIRMGDGRCALHAECGEDALPEICRLYPRGIHLSEDGYECSLADSCEATLEIFFDRDKPIKFVEREMTLAMPRLGRPTVVFKTMGHEREIRMRLIGIMQDRDHTIPERIIGVGLFLREVERAIDCGNEAALIAALNESTLLTEEGISDKRANGDNLRFGLRVARRMVDILDVRSESIRKCGEAAIAYFGGSEGDLERYHIAKERFEKAFPRWEIFFEHMLVNHIFFSKFPFQDRPERLYDEFLGLCGVYTVLRFLGLGSAADEPRRDLLIDGMAAAFRLIDHTEYDRYISHILKGLDCTTPDKIADLLCL